MTLVAALQRAGSRNVGLPHTQMTNTYALRYVACNLRYMAIPSVAGTRTVLRSLQTASDDVLAAVTPHVPTHRMELLNDDNFVARQLARYGFWDATFRIQGHHMPMS